MSKNAPAPLSQTPTMSSIQGSLALSFIEQGPHAQSHEPANATSTAELDRFAERFAHVLVEVMAGNRGPQQLSRWSSLAVYQELTQRCAAMNRVGPARDRRRVLPIQLQRVRFFCPTKDAAEISIVAKHGHRFRAIAARIEHTGKRWTCTAIQFG